jgi:hypothetical protein
LNARSFAKPGFAPAFYCQIQLTGTFSCIRAKEDVMWLKSRFECVEEADVINRPLKAGPCTTCLREMSQGSRDANAVCAAFNPSAPGGSVCWTCSHSWKDHS